MIRQLATVLCGTLTLAAAQPRSWEQVQGQVDAWHTAEKGAELPDARLRVVYFHGNDREPLVDYQARLGRVLEDISLFYQEGMGKWGIASKGLPLEKDAGGKLVIHMVKGAKPSASYDYKSGGETEAEARLALKGTIDFDREFVLILYGQCWQLKDGRYGFYAPYYGKGGSCQEWGLCHAADCHLLDPQLLTDTKTRFKYWEHYGDRDQTVAKFNSFYLGGIAHELGHGLGLPHEMESPAQTTKLGASLMGSGNLTYRQDVWDGAARSSFLSEAAAVRLLSHPLVTKHQRARFEDDESDFRELHASFSAGSLSVSGRLESKIPAYAVIAYVDPDGGSDYDAQTYIAKVEDGKFSLGNMPVPRGKVMLRLTACRMNGGVTTIGCDIPRGDGGVDAAALVAKLGTAELSLAEMAVAQKWKSAVERVARLRSRTDVDWSRHAAVLERCLAVEKPSLVDLAEVKGESCYLSDAVWKTAYSGWAGTPRDVWGADPRIGQGLFLSLGGELQEKGLPAHCPARHVFDLGGRWTRFQAKAGIRDGAGRAGRAIFIVKADDKEIYRSSQLAEGAAADIDLDVTGVKELQLSTESGLDTTHTCWAVWGVPVVKR